MIDQSIVNVAPPAKITPPETGRFFARPELSRNLAELIASPRKLWVSSPGGSGKTTLVRALLDEDPRPLLWYQVDQGDQDPASFFYYLAQAVPEGEIGSPPLPQLGPEYLPNLAVFCRNFFRALFARFAEGCVLVFDDLQEGPGEILFRPVLFSAMAELPANSAIIVLSREEPYPSFSRDRINRSLAHLGWDELRLSRDETRRFLSWSCGHEPQLQTLNQAYDMTQGWVAGLQLFLENQKDGLLTQKSTFERTDLLFDYFAGEIFSRLPEGTRDFLLTCGFLPTIEVSLAEILTGRTDTGDILRGLVRENHFTFRISTAPEVYRFHPLFRQFLLSRVEQLDAQRLSTKRDQAARLLIGVGQIETAVDLLIQIQAWPLLLEQIAAQVETLLSQGRSQTLLQWLSAFPTELKEADPNLCYWSGCCLMAQNPAEACSSFSKAFELFEGQCDVEGSMLAWAMVVNAIIVGWDDYSELDRWIDHFDRLHIRYPDFPSPEIEALMIQGICKALAWRQPARADLPEWGNRLHNLVTTSSDSSFRLLAGSNLTLYHIISGDLVAANSLVEILNSDLYSAEATPLKKLIWFSTRAVLEWILMDRDGCLATIEAGRSIIEESGIHVLDLRLYGQGITLGLSLGDLELVQRLLDEIPTTPITRTLDHAHSCLLLADYSLLKGETAKAIALAETAVKRSQGGGNRIIEAFSLAGLIQALYQDGQMKRAATVLEEGLILAKGMNHFTSYFQLLAAYFALLRNDLKEAHQLLRKGFGLAARQGYLNYHPWRDAIMVRICREAIAADIEVEYVNRLAARHQLDITPADQVSLTPKEIEILTWVQEGKTSWEIAKILGITERTVNFHVGNVLRKLEVNSRSQALAVAMRLGFLNKS